MVGMQGVPLFQTSTIPILCVHHDVVVTPTTVRCHSPRLHATDFLSSTVTDSLTHSPHFLGLDTPMWSSPLLLISPQNYHHHHHVLNTMKAFLNLTLLTSLCLMVYGFQPLRFLQQSSRFVQFPGPASSSTRVVVVQPGDVLYQAGRRKILNEFDFAPLDDVVMGGVSSSGFANGIWKGTVTDANNGGFIGIRSTPNGKTYDLTACRGLQVKVRLVKSPNNKNNKRLRFKFATRDATDFNGITWATSVDATVGQATVWKVPLRKQKPTRFARIVANESFRSDNLVGVQFVFSKFEYNGALNPYFALGDVELQIDEIKAY